jgi:hypothetical protein
MTFGFILTRHVNSHKTNKYWIRSVRLINSIYPQNRIIIIDDNSNNTFLTKNEESKLKNLTVIQSEYPGRGELLPFIYLLKYKWFDAAVIMHDGVFVHKKINFQSGLTPDVLPLWHYPYNTPSGKEDFHHVMHITRCLTNGQIIRNKLANHSTADKFGLNLLNTPTYSPNQLDFNLCFGVQTYIKLSFLEMLENKYHITNLLQHVKCRRDRCALERIMGCIFHAERPICLNKRPSLFGHILKHKNAYVYTYQNYMQDVVRKKIPGYFVKVWSGR